MRAMVTIGTAAGFFGGLLLGFVLGVSVKQTEVKELMRLLMAIVILLVWIAAFVCSVTIGYEIPIGIHTVAGLVAGWLFGVDRLVRRNGGKNGKQ